MKKVFVRRSNRFLSIGLIFLLGIPPIFTNHEIAFANTNTGSEAVTGYLPGLDKFKVDINEEKQNLINSFKMTKGLTMAYKESNQKLAEASKAVEANPSDKTTINELDDVYAQVLAKLSQRMVLVLTEEPKINKSFQTIEKEFTDASGFLKEEQIKIKDDIKSNSVRHEEIKKALGQKARYYEGLPESSPEKEEMKEKIRELALELELVEYQLNLDADDLARYASAIDQMNMVRNFYGKMHGQAGQLLKKIDAERRKYARIAKRRDRFQNIRHVMWGVDEDEGGLAGLIDNMEQTFDILTNFSEIEKNVSDQIDSLTFTLPVRNGSNLADKIKQWDNNFAEKISYYGENYF